MDDVEVGQAWLDHQNVGTLLLIEQGFDQGSPAVGRSILVRWIVVGIGLGAGGARR